MGVDTIRVKRVDGDININIISSKSKRKFGKGARNHSNVKTSFTTEEPPAKRGKRLNYLGGKGDKNWSIVNKMFLRNYKDLEKKA
ncbi:hypothetical protein ABG067_007841 [Albugo candida]